MTDPEDSDRVLDPDQRERIEAVLDRVRICDPAVGSGAFLLGAMQEMVRLRKGMAHATGEYDAEIEERVEDWKRRAIEHSLYGVDINPEAVEICQLRLWLSLVLDYQGHPREVRPLPNLDFRIRVGDSLIDRFEDVAFVESLPTGSYQAPFEVVGKLDGEHEKIERWLTEYEHAIPSRQREIRDLVQKAKLRVLKAQVTAQREEAASKVSAGPALGAAAKAKQARAAKKAERALAAYDEALIALDGIEAERPRVEKPFLWPLAFPEVFEDGGFDLVIANPPYVRMEKLSNSEEHVFAMSFTKVSASRADLLVYFFSRGLQILKAGGHLAFITSNKYMRAGYGSKLRSTLKTSLSIDRIIDFGDLPLFESNGKSVAAYPAILLGSKSDIANQDVAVVDLTSAIRRTIAERGAQVTPEEVREAIDDLDALLLASESRGYSQSLLKDDGWVLDHPRLVELFDRLMVTGIPLGEAVQGRVYFGLKTGLDRAFVISSEERDRLIASDPRSAELIHPWLRGRDVKRWRTQWAGLHIIFARRGTPIEEYPAILTHLSQFRKDLEKRATAKTHPWYELQQPQEGIYHEFREPKIIFTRFLRAPSFAFDSQRMFVGMACAFAVVPSHSYAALVNSRIVWWILTRLTTRLQNGYYQLFTQFIERIPIPQLTPALDADLSSLAAELSLKPEDAHTEDRLNQLVYDAYGLNADERQAIDSWWVATLQDDSLSSGEEPGDEDDG